MRSLLLWKLLRDAIRSNTPSALLLTVDIKGSGPGKPGATMALTANGMTRGTVGGGVMEHRLLAEARRMIDTGSSSPELIRFDHMDENDAGNEESKNPPSGMICSGSQTTVILPVKPDMLESVNRIISILEDSGTGTLRLSGTGLEVSDSTSSETHFLTETGGWSYTGPLGSPDTVYIFGGGHVGQALVRLLPELGFNSVIIDERERDSFENPPSCRWITAPFNEAYSFIREGRHSWAVIMTPFHEADAEVLHSLAGIELRYVGMMASSTKKTKIYSELMRKGVTEEFLDEVHCPIGIPVGSRTPPEIAISIAAQLLRVRSCI